ncbi:hypothetical protein B5P21_15885 [Clavibacter michiganensis subsp. insidiosus]|nr:hypothetical protein B5P21_15885 [Clavibacter michiganensis subsp. insidiosus]
MIDAGVEELAARITPADFPEGAFEEAVRANGRFSRFGSYQAVRFHRPKLAPGPSLSSGRGRLASAHTG